MSDRNESRGRDRDSERGSGRDRSSRDEGGDRGRRSSRDDSDRGGRDSGRGSRSGSSYEYQERDAKATVSRGSRGNNDFDKILVDGVKMFKPNDGDNRVRFLPPTWKGAQHFGLDVYVHYGVGPDRATYLCLEKMKGEPDPIAEERVIARRDGDEDYAKDLEAKGRVLVYLIDRDHEKEGVQAWVMPRSVDSGIIKVSQDKSTGEVLPIDHPDEGYDVEFEKKGTGLKTEYLGIAIARRSTPLGKGEWLDYAVDNPLPDQLNYFDYDHIAKVFNGGSGASKRNDRDDDRPSRSNRDDRDSNSDRSSSRREEPSSRSDRGRSSRDSEDTSSRDPGRDRSASREAPRASEEPTWDSIHAMTGNELEDLIDQEKLDINPGEAKSDDDLADWICEEMKIKKVEARSTRRAVSDDKEDTSSRLRDMRRGRD